MSEKNKEKRTGKNRRKGRWEKMGIKRRGEKKRANRLRGQGAKRTERMAEKREGN